MTHNHNNHKDLREALSEFEKRHVGGMNVAVAVDGSQMSEKAAQVAARLVDSKRKDRLIVLHVSDKTKLDKLPKNLLPQHLKTHYQDMPAMARITMEWVCREKDEGMSTCMAVTKMATKSQASVLVVGSFGQKGENLEMLGSVSDFSLRESPASVCIVRSTGNIFDKLAKFIFCTDGSHAAALAFCTLIKRIMRPTDIVHVIMISTTDGVKESVVINHYREFMLEHKVVGEATVKCIDRSVMPVYRGILDAANEQDADVLVMGISGYGLKKLGSVSEHIAIHAGITTIIIKDSYEILSNRYSNAGSMSVAKDITPSGRQ